MPHIHLSEIKNIGALCQNAKRQKHQIKERSLAGVNCTALPQNSVNSLVGIFTDSNQHACSRQPRRRFTGNKFHCAPVTIITNLLESPRANACASCLVKLRKSSAGADLSLHEVALPLLRDFLHDSRSSRHASRLSACYRVGLTPLRCFLVLLDPISIKADVHVAEKPRLLKTVLAANRCQRIWHAA